MNNLMAFRTSKSEFYFMENVKPQSIHGKNVLQQLAGVQALSTVRRNEKLDFVLIPRSATRAKIVQIIVCDVNAGIHILKENKAPVSHQIL